ncbi:MAG: nucleotidyltransferase family protein [Oscillospiraceae bacterium]|jgi:molybdenum cofactor cytidylyltransferase|nr:nucleotidyltransferase family protein [Oscillospiraceae bacterium]
MQLKVSAILTAAGLSERMGSDKLLLKYSGKTLLQKAVDLLYELPVKEKILVTTEDRLEKIELPVNIKIVINKYPEKGHSRSVRLGVEKANETDNVHHNRFETSPLETIESPEQNTTHFLFLVADQPKLTKADIMQIIDAGEINQDKIIYPVINDKPGTPSLFPIKFSDELLRISGDTGGRVIRDLYLKSCLAVLPTNPERFADINTMEEYNALNDC